jgi:steroid delta-isomerase-like uncharacterized protein
MTKPLLLRYTLHRSPLDLPFVSLLRKGKEYRMTPADVARLVEEWAIAWSSSHAQEKLTSLFTDDCVYEDLAMGITAHGKAELAQLYTTARNAFPDYKVEVTAPVVAGDRGGAEWVMSGTHTGDLPGLPATNKYASVRAASIFELRGDKVSRWSDYFDMVTVLKQVGAMPSN